MRRFELVGPNALSGCARVLGRVGAALALSAPTQACAALPATVQLRAANVALERATSLSVVSAPRGRAERPADRTYRLTLAAALLEKAREDAAGGRFESARNLAREAAQLAAGAPGGGA